MSELQTQIQLWADFKAQCATADGIPDFDQYAAHLINGLRAQLADAQAERDALRVALEAIAAPGVNAPNYKAWFEECQEIAREALATLDGPQ